MKGTPSACACMAAALDGSTFSPRIWRRNSAVSSWVNRATFSLRTMPSRSMSATRFTASVTKANSSGRIEAMMKIGLPASERTRYRISRRLSSSAHWRSSNRSATGRTAASVRNATAARSRVRRSFRSGGSVSSPGSSFPDSESTLRWRASAAGVPCAASAASSEPKIERANRKGPRISWSAATATVMNPCAAALSEAARRRRVLPMPGSPSTVRAARRPDRAVASSC